MAEQAAKTVHKEVAIVPLSKDMVHDLQAGTAKFDSWLKEVSGGYVTLSRIETVASALPVVGNVIAAVDVAMGIYDMTQAPAVGAFDWAMLGIDLIGVIPLPPVMAQARTTARPIFSAVKQSLKHSGNDIGEALVVVIIDHMHESHAGDIEKFANGLKAQIKPILDDGAKMAQGLTNDLATICEKVLSGKLFDARGSLVNADKKYRVAQTTSWRDPGRKLGNLWGALMDVEAAVAKKAANLSSGALSSQIPEKTRKQLQAIIRKLRVEFGPLMAQKIRGLNSAEAGGLVWLMDKLLEAVARFRKKRGAKAGTVAHQSTTNVKAKKSSTTIESHHVEAKSKKPGPNECKSCGTPNRTKKSIGFALGDELLSHTDFSLPGVMGVTWTRTYRSSFYPNDRGEIGARWITPYSTRIDLRKREMLYHDATGRSVHYPILEVGSSHDDPVESLTLSRLSDTLLSITRGHELIEVYELHGKSFRLAMLKDRPGNSIVMSYDETGRIQALAGSAGFKVNFNHDQQGRILSVAQEGEEGPRVLASYHYSPAGDLVEATDENGHKRQYAYQNHLITRYTDRTDRGMNLEWNGRRPNARCIREFADDGSYDTKLAWNPDIRLTLVTDALGNVTRYYNDLAGYTYRVVNSDNTEEWFFRDDHKNLTKHVHPDGSVDRYAYDERDNLIEHTRNDESVLSFKYDDKDQLIETIDPEGYVWKRAYDDKGNVVEETDPKERVTRYKYNEQGLPVEITDAKGGKKKLEYTAAGQLTSYTDCSGSETKWAYDALGRLSTVEDAAGNATTYAYGQGGELSSITPADGNVQTFNYDAEGRLLSHTDMLKRTTRYSYDKAGRIQSRSDALNQNLSYQYDLLGRLTSLSNENGAHYNFAYDALGRLLRETGFDGKVSEYHYEAGSGRLERIAEAGHVTELSYDLAGRLTQRKSSGSEETFLYDASGRLGLAKNRYSQIKLQYDEVGDLIKEEHAYHLFGAKQHYHWQHEYDELGNRRRTIRPDGSVNDWLVYGSGHVHGILWNGHELAHIERDKLHRETERSLGNQLKHNTQYDPVGRILQQSLTGKTQLKRQYSYDASGQLTGIEDSRKGSTQYRYDPVGRLLAAIGPKHNETFAFDPAGNRVDPASPETARTQAPSSTLPSHLPKLVGNLLKEYAGTHFDYDARGNLTQKQKQGQSTSYQWDGFNRLKSVNNGNSETHYFYDPFGRRIAKQSGEHQIYFGWQGDMLAWESEQDQTTHYLYEPGSFVPLAQVKSGKINNHNSIELTHEEAEFATQEKPKPEAYYYHCDHLGTPQELTDLSGELAWQAHYKAWGEAQEIISEAAQSAGIKNPLRFQGQYADGETGLHYNRYRYYDPDLGRFISQDPIGLAGGNHPYGYAPNPLMWVDPLGLTKNCKHCPCPAGTLDPKDIHFMQSSAKNNTGDYTVLGNAKSLSEGSLDPNILKIKVWKDTAGKIWTLDHRRLASFKLAGKCVPVEWASPQEVKDQMWKMTTATGGKSMRLKIGDGKSIKVE